MNFPDYISRLRAKDLIAERTRPHYENKRAWKNKINGRLKYQVKTGKISTNPKGHLSFMELCVYVRNEHPGKFNDWPTPQTTLKIIGSLPPFTGVIHLCVLPTEIGECHKQILSLYKENQELKKKIQELNPWSIN